MKYLNNFLEKLSVLLAPNVEKKLIKIPVMSKKKLTN